MKNFLVIEAIRFNVLFLVLFGIAALFGDTSISLLSWMAICNVVLVLVILPYLAYTRRSRKT
ncbi:MAG: hypothetical protein EOP37_11430 [Rubrivivax sp.]|nr:MAG: hypothetical protein EOP37_11430 [Rubrivivax sp.]